jgi:hypothetical protein
MSFGLFVRNVLEIFVLFPHLIGISQRHPEEPLDARFERDDVLARGEDNSPKRHHPFLTDRLANDRERLLADFAVVPSTAKGGRRRFGGAGRRGSQFRVKSLLLELRPNDDQVDRHCVLPINR